MLRITFLFVLLAVGTCVFAQRGDCYVWRDRFEEIPAKDWYGMHMANLEAQRTGEDDRMVADLNKLTKAEEENNRWRSDSFFKRWERNVLLSGMDVELREGASAGFMFMYDSSKLYLTASRNSIGFKMGHYFTRGYYEILFTDSSFFRQQKPFGTTFDFHSVFLLLDGSLEVLQFDEKRKPGGTKVLHGDTALLNKMLSVPVHEITMYSACDKRFEEFPEDCPNEEFSKYSWVLPEASGKQVMGYLQCLYAEIHKQPR